MTVLCDAAYDILRLLFLEQVNGAINSKGQLFGIGISSRHFWVLMNTDIGIDFEWNSETVGVGRLGEWGLDIDMENLIVNIRCQNAIILATLTSGGHIDLKIHITDRCSTCN